jgi:hypothetical protein
MQNEYEANSNYLDCIAFFLATQSVQAALGRGAGVSQALPVSDVRVSWLNFSGKSDAYSGKTVRKLQSVPMQWVADIFSYTDFPPLVITLGWRSFSATERCNTTPMQNVQGLPTSIPNSEIAASIFVTPKSCSGTRYGKSSGNHEFKFGGKTVTHTFEVEGTVP